MNLFSNPDPEDEEPKKGKLPSYTGLAVFAALLPVDFFFDHIGEFDLGLNIGICLGTNALVVIMRWKLRKHIWFWAIIAVVVALEIPIAMNVKWPDRWVPAAELWPIGLAGALVALGAISLAEKLFMKDPPDEE